MNKYRLIFLIWLLPVYFIFQCSYQVYTFFGMQNTFENGESYVAEVTGSEIKQIAAQTNGYIILKFTTSESEIIEQQLAEPVQLLEVITDSEVIPIRYDKDSVEPIVIIQTYDLQKKMIWANIAVTLIGLIVTLILSLYASKYAGQKIRDGDEKLEIERIDG